MATFPRTNRLTQSNEFKTVYRHGKKMSLRGFHLYSCPNALSHARLGMVVSKRVHGKAVKRNQLKRLIRESFRKCGEIPAVDILLIAQPSLGRTTPSDITALCNACWEYLATLSASAP